MWIEIALGVAIVIVGATYCQIKREEREGQKYVNWETESTYLTALGLLETRELRSPIPGKLSLEILIKHRKDIIRAHGWKIGLRDRV